MSDKKEPSRIKLAIYAVAGIIIGVAVHSITLYNFGFTADARKLKDACEKNMPRNEHCTMEYVNHA